MITRGNSDYFNQRQDECAGGSIKPGGAKPAVRWSAFKPGGTTRFEILQKDSSGDLGFWTGFQLATVQLAGQDKPVGMRIRVTEVFRRVDGEWKMVHRHADVPQKPRQ